MSVNLIVLDANILIRAVLGTRVRNQILDNVDAVKFFAPDVAYDDARKYLPDLLEKRAIPAAPALAVLDALIPFVPPLETDFYFTVKRQALRRIGRRDPDDWPVLACAIILECPVWTEDVDFFGAGVATWSSASIDTFFEELKSR
jgi:predicted nucleic acid-binding protein